MSWYIHIYVVAWAWLSIGLMEWSYNYYKGTIKGVKEKALSLPVFMLLGPIPWATRIVYGGIR